MCLRVVIHTLGGDKKGHSEKSDGATGSSWSFEMFNKLQIIVTDE